MTDKKDSLAFLEKERKFNKGMQDLKSAPVEMVDDFQRTVVKDMPVDRLDTKGVQKLTTGGDFMADQIIGDARRNAVKQAGDTLNYKDLKKEFALKNKPSMGRKLLGAIPMLGAAATFATTGDASAAAEELPGDIPFLGQAYEAIRPETAGDVEGERQLLKEIEAMKNYGNSPAHQARLQALKGIK